MSAIKAPWTVGETESIALTVYIEISLQKKKEPNQYFYSSNQSITLSIQPLFYI